MFLLRLCLFVTCLHIIIMIHFCNINFFQMIPKADREANEKKERKQSGQSSSLDYLNNEGGEQDKDDAEISSRKRPRDWVEKDSQLRKVVINNRRKEKMVQVDASCQGIFLYKPGVELPSLFQFANQTIKIIIANQYIKRDNPEVLKRNLYGSDTFTSNSDCVCMGIHSGFLSFNNSNKKCEGYELSCKVVKPKKNYTGCLKNNFLSRSIKGYNGNALKPEAVKALATLGPMENLQKYASNMHIPIGKNRVRAKPRNISSIIPIPQTHLVFNMNNEPAFKYSIFNMADKGFDKNQFLVRKLDNFVLYLENDRLQKFELAKVIESDYFEVYRFAKLKDPFKLDNDYFANNTVPLDPKDLQIFYNKLEWDQIVWGNSSVRMKDTRIEGLQSFKYYKRPGAK